MHVRYEWHAGIVAVLCCLLLSACASVRFNEDLADYEDRIDDLEQRLRRSPQDATALRDLGIIYLRTNQFARANEYLQNAFSFMPDDPALLFHLGLANEALGRPEAALRVYQDYPQLSRLSPYRRLMAGRYQDVSRTLMEQQVAATLAEEDELLARGQSMCAEPNDPRVVAVYPLSYQGGDEQYAPLGRGLAEMLTVDLASVDELRVVERARVQALLDEIELASQAAFDPSTAPRVGCLIGAGRLVGGVYNLLGDRDLQVDAGLWESGAVENLGLQSGSLNTLFTLQKDLLFRLLERMGIELTPQQRQELEFIPTQNLQAFLAYSRGLLEEDEGNYLEAARQYQQAADLDPSFQMAADRADRAEGMVQVSGSLMNAMVAAAQQDTALPQPVTLGSNLMTTRLVNLNHTLGVGIVPSLEGREGSAEVTTSGVTIGSLPDPPRPPSRE